MAAPTEREIVVNAFGECAGEYSGAHKRFRMQAADDAIADERQTVSDVRRLVEEHCGDVFPQLLVAAPPPTTATPAEIGSAEGSAGHRNPEAYRHAQTHRHAATGRCAIAGISTTSKRSATCWS